MIHRGRASQARHDPTAKTYIPLLIPLHSSFHCSRRFGASRSLRSLDPHALQGRLGVRVLLTPHPLERFERGVRDNGGVILRRRERERIEAGNVRRSIGIDQVDDRL